MKRAVFPGSFDPMTNGHMDIIKRASRLFDEVIVLVGTNASKNSMFSVEERVAMIADAIKPLSNVKVDSYDGLVALYAKEHEAEFLVKGLRNGMDFQYETTMESYNRLIAPQVETVYLASEQDKAILSSSSVKELIRFQVDVKALVPAPVYEYLLEKNFEK